MAEFAGIYTEEEREGKISKEHARLKKILRALGPDLLEIQSALIQEAAFIAITLEETRKIIMRDGIIETYQNGANQSGMKKSSAVEVYDKFVNTYKNVIKQLCETLPAQSGKDAAEEILKFALSGK